ncbi:MAG: addiction module protein [Zoogloeaceae bacterium]|jgi:hypothetical protein|nr:addiction module protein [Zoogloeaceae bacterium]
MVKCSHRHDVETETMLALETLSRADKLKLMETLWDDLSANAADLASPEWHGEALDAARRAYDAGEAALIDWPQAKRQLRVE